MTTQTYQQASQRFLAQAKQELATGDLQQASEKGWGAAAQMLKAIAEQRSWEHGKHRHLSHAASRLRAETGDRDVYRFFSVANDLHGNFYENEMSAEDIAESLAGLYAKSNNSNGCPRSGAAPPVAGVGRFFTVRSWPRHSGTPGRAVSATRRLPRSCCLKCVKSSLDDVQALLDRLETLLEQV